MSFTGSEDHSITLAEAAIMTKAFRDANPGKIIANFVGKDAIQAILDQPGCVGIRFYNAVNAAGQNTLVLVGADAAENDMDTGLLANQLKPCPTYCSTANPLNS